MPKQRLGVAEPFREVNMERSFDRRQMVPSGFTLVELLVVISIIAILAAFLFPVAIEVRAKAHQTTCVSNLAQIARAGMMYVEDNDERLPTCYPLRVPPYAVDPRTSLQPYVKNWAVFYCPERQTVLDECLDPEQNFEPHARCMGYGYNWGSGLGWAAILLKSDGLVRRATDDSGSAIGVSLSEVAIPSHTFFYGDTDDLYFLTLLRNAMPGVHKVGMAVNDLGEVYEPPRHSGGNNFAFVDGHVQWLRFHGGTWQDGGPWVVPDMSMYSRTGRWEMGTPP